MALIDTRGGTIRIENDVGLVRIVVSDDSRGSVTITSLTADDADNLAALLGITIEMARKSLADEERADESEIGEPGF